MPLKTAESFEIRGRFESIAYIWRLQGSNYKSPIKGKEALNYTM